MKSQTSASKKLGLEDAVDLLKKSKRVFIASGKKVERHTLNKGADLEAIANQMLGRTGNLRAPTLRVGKDLYVGFPKGGFEELEP